MSDPRRKDRTRVRREVLGLQSALYCGVPAANAALAVAQRVLNEPDG
jgi:alkylhydroperoxidase/carboxymuconolactone decarboxylase family protein YurZ